MKKFALVDLKGGLGNQIFIFCFAHYLKSNNYYVALDAGFFKYNQQFPRELEIDLNRTNLKTLTFRNNRLFFFLNTWFEEVDDIKNLNTKLLNRFTGYYQDLNYLNKFKDEVFNMLGIKLEPRIKDSCMIHIRNGDYIDLGEDLKNSYYDLSINQITEQHPNLFFDIFTDNDNLKLDKNIYKRINNIYYPDRNSNSIDTLKKMMRYEHYIIANSTYSLIAAYLSAENNSKVFYPSPWWRNFDVKIINFPDNWIKIKNG